MDFISIWAGLKENKALGSANIISERLKDSKKLVSLGVSSTHYYFFFQLNEEYQEHNSELVNCVGFSSEYKIYDFQFSSHHLILSCNQNSESELKIFESLCLDIYLSIDKLSSEEKSYKAFLLRLKIWEDFFSSRGRRSLNYYDQVGLYGELHFLEKIIDLCGPSDAISYWKGPIPETHDFKFNNLKVEIKTTTNEEKKIHTSPRQLDPKINNLYIYLLELEEVDYEFSKHLGEKVEIIRNKLDLVTLENFEDLLKRAGYSDLDVSHYEKYNFKVKTSGYYYLKAGFPVLEEAEIAAISQVKYVLDLNLCSDYIENPSEVEGRFFE